ncbi:BRO-N domain-containing protein [Type-E symbiont of Plautia stali]|uniref:BRO-N domain-containing protein n=1 Tax=Type-E symbiont of Plautia stali TaxID=1560357 RepID=UPI00073F1552|nr:BRO family protein [Type-E symbiont of Plautia stali]
MNNNLMKICYQGETGESDVRTMILDEVLYVSLKDVLLTLNKENRKIDENFITKSMVGLLKAQIEVLESDEFINVKTQDSKYPGETEVFVTQPGLYRVMSSDKSAAGKKFQKWLFHEVIPSLTKHGSYPPPVENKGSALAQMAEILAQNSRLLADTIIKQEILEKDVLHVKGKVESFDKRLLLLEDSANNDEMNTLNERLSYFGLFLNEADYHEALGWCENITFSKAREKVYSSERGSIKYTIQTIDEVISIMNEKIK